MLHSNQLSRQIVKALGLILACACCFAAICGSAAAYDSPETESVQTSGSEEPGQELNGAGIEAAKNDDYSLVVDTETGFFEVRSKDGRVWKSNCYTEENTQDTLAMWKNYMRSQLIVYYASSNGKSQDNVNSYIYSARKDGLSIYQLEQGFAAKYDFETINATVWLYVRLTDHGLEVSVPFDRIETKSENILITDITVLPFFGAAERQENGFILIPDGSGALISLNRSGDTISYSTRIYGEDDALKTKRQTEVTPQAIMPVYGLSAAGGSFFTVITDGAATASVEAYTAGNQTVFNQVYASFQLRSMDEYTTTDWSGDERRTVMLENGYIHYTSFTQQYYLLEPNTSYSEMASLYRQQLLDNGILEAPSEEAYPASAVELYGAVLKKEPVLGIPINLQKKLTTYEEAAEILADLKQQGAGDPLLLYKNALKSQVTEKKLSGGEHYGKLGSKKDLEALKQAVGGSRLFIECNPFTAKKTNFSFLSMGKMASTLTGGPVYRYQYELATGFGMGDTRKTVYKTEYAAKLLKNYQDKLEKEQAETIFIDGIGRSVYSDFSKEDQNREEAIRTYEEMLAGIDGMTVMVDTGNAYTWRYADWIASIPQTASKNQLIDQEIPFVQMVLCGYKGYTCEPVNLTSNIQRSFLKAVETHSTLTFSFIYRSVENIEDTELQDKYALDYTLWKQDAAEMLSRQKEVFDKTGNAVITEHTFISPELVKVTYENGVRIYVNYGQEDQNADGTTVPAMDFVLLS